MMPVENFLPMSIRGRRLVRALLAAAFLTGTIALATGASQAYPAVSAPTPTSPAPMPAPAPAELSSLDQFNAAMHGFNLWAFQKIDAIGEWAGALHPSPAVSAGLSNMLSNFINEPTAAVSWAVAGNYDYSLTALWRFWTNTTRGWLGTVDVARSEGVVTPPIDIGLALCTRGVGEGAYMVLPLVGPRTVRDGVSDFLLINAITYLTLAPIIGFPPSLQTIATLEVVEEVGKVTAMRQIDHGDDRNPSADAVKEEYLKSRRQRCEQLMVLLNSRDASRD